MPTPKMWKLYKTVKPGSDEHKAVVHAYFHLLHAERGVRAAEGMHGEYGHNEFVEFWQDYAIRHFLSFREQIARIPDWEEYLNMRLGFHADRREEKMYRAVDDNSRKSYPKAEAAAKKARRKLRARYN